MKKKVLSFLLMIAMCLTLLPQQQVSAASYEVRAVQAKVTTVIGHAPYELFTFYKNGERIKAPEKAKYVSSDSSVVKIENDYGTTFFRGKKAGTATITCTYKGVSATATITVKKFDVDYNGLHTIYLPVDSTFYLNFASYNNKNIGNITVKSSNTKIVTAETSKIKPFVSSSDKTVSYDTPSFITKKTGSATLTFKSKVGTEKIKVYVLPAMKLEVSDVKREKVDDEYQYSYKITNKSSKAITVGGPVEIPVTYNIYTAFMNEEETTLAKGESATYTFSVPFSSEDSIVDESILSIYYQNDGRTFWGFVDIDGKVTDPTYLGKVSMTDAVRADKFNTQ